ncbi:MAG: hypothetical protein JW395_0225 [Nitrospira sp.]|nr:hypothetical protein [Nitrospira sp.]
MSDFLTPPAGEDEMQLSVRPHSWLTLDAMGIKVWLERPQPLCMRPDRPIGIIAEQGPDIIISRLALLGVFQPEGGGQPGLPFKELLGGGRILSLEHDLKRLWLDFVLKLAVYSSGRIRELETEASLAILEESERIVHPERHSLMIPGEVRTKRTLLHHYLKRGGFEFLGEIDRPAGDIQFITARQRILERSHLGFKLPPGLLDLLAPLLFDLSAF